MWELHNNADWDCFQTLTLPEILRIQNRPQGEFAYLEVTRFFPHVGCARNELLFRTIQRNLRLFLSMQVYEWTEFPLFIFGIWFLKCCILLPTKLRNPKNMSRETSCMTHLKKDTKNQVKAPIQYNDLELRNFDSVSSNVDVFSIWCDALHFEDNEAVIKMIIQGSNETRIPNPQSCA